MNNPPQNKPSPPKNGGGNKGDGKNGKKGDGKGGGKKHGGGSQSINGMSLQDLFSIGMNLAHPVRQTKQDMNLIYGPQIRGLKNDYTNYANQMGSLYTVLGNEIGKQGAGADDNYQHINNDYTHGTQDILGSLQQTTAPDQAAFLNSLGAQALAGSRDLAQSATNESRYNASMGDQAALENTILQRNAAGDLNTGLDELRKQRSVDFRTTLDQNRQTAFERMLALKEYQLRAAQVAQSGKGDKWTRQFYADMFGNAMGGGGGGGNGGGGNGGGGNGGNTNGPVGDQQGKLNGRNIVDTLLHGEKKYGQLTDRKQNFVNDLNLKPWTSAIGSSYQGMGGNPSNSTLLQMLKQISRGHLGGGGGVDHFPGPGR